MFEDNRTVSKIFNFIEKILDLFVNLWCVTSKIRFSFTIIQSFMDRFEPRSFNALELK